MQTRKGDPGKHTKLHRGDFGEDGIDAQATKYKELALLTDKDSSVIKRQSEEATSAGVPILRIIGDTR